MKGNYQELQNLVGKNIIMVLTDTIGDMLATIRNGLLVEKENIKRFIFASTCSNYGYGSSTNSQREFS